MSNEQFLIFLESNTKKVTIKTFLGNNYTIFATGGHLMELKKDGPYNLGVDLEKFKPNYEILNNKRSLIKYWNEYLNKNKNLKIFLATDPDREGEAIAREIVQVLNLDENKENYKRLLFHEITSVGVLNSLENPIEINRNLVEAQTARQVLDQMIGFCLSKLLQKKQIQAWSAGRVQSVVLKLIVEREQAIINHGDRKEYRLEVSYKNGRHIFHLYEKNKNGELVLYNSKEEAEQVKENLAKEFELKGKTEKEKFVFPKNPLTTSLLLYEAKSQLGFSISQTTQLAQQLYEGITLKNNKKRISLITYPRTDSSRISKVFTAKAYKFIEKNWGENLCYFKSAQQVKSKQGNIQDAHEAIRPTYLDQTPEKLIKEGIESDQLKLYELIFKHTIASFMQPAKYLNKVYEFENKGRIFQMVDNVIISPGYFTFIEDGYKIANIKKENVINEKDIQKIMASIIKVQEYLGNIPKRYTEGSLIKKLEALGIGRPSTYNSFTKIMIKRKYASFDKKGCFTPTELGVKVNEWLQAHFSSLINENYTAHLEEDLDRISQGENSYFSFIKNFWENFYPNFKKLNETKE